MKIVLLNRRNLVLLPQDFNHEKLSSDSRRCFIEQTNRNEEKTIELMSKIEEFFSHKGAKINYCKILNEDIDFYENDWRMSPIYLSTTSNSLIGYHLLKKSVYLYMLATGVKGFYDRLSFLKAAAKQKIKNLILVFFKPNVINNYLYHKHFNRFKRKIRYKKYKVENTHPDDKSDQNTNPHDKYIISTRLIKLLWRI